MMNTILIYILRRASYVGFLLIALLITAGCSETFEPLQENDRYNFSIYGYLDASADTQWVRVMPVRDSLFFSPRPIDAQVTLENTATGQSVEMQDSLFSYPRDTYAYNFWTTMDLQPEQAYRITAKRTSNPKNTQSYAEVTLPFDFPAPVVQVSTSFRIPDFVYIDGVEHLADVQAVFYGRSSTAGEVRLLGIHHRQDTVRATEYDYKIAIDPEAGDHPSDDADDSFPPVFKSQIFVASAGPGFQDFSRIDEKIVALPEGVSNVTNGVGYLRGIVSKTVPYKSCYDEDEILIACPLEPPLW